VGRVVVIGVGNEFRRDDAAGPAVVTSGLGARAVACMALACPGAGRDGRRKSRSQVPKVPYFGPGGAPVNVRTGPKSLGGSPRSGKAVTNAPGGAFGAGVTVRS
jgi:hypothetical protein